MGVRRVLGKLAIASLIFLAPPSVAAQPAPGSGSEVNEAKSGLVRYTAGERVQLAGVPYEASRAGEGYYVLSSEFIVVAVLSGAIASDGKQAGPGEVLVTPIEGRRTERFLFDAAVLARTLPPGVLAEVGPLLTPIADHQRRMRYLGRIQAVGINAAAPAGPAETLRRNYLNDPAIVEIRRRAAGNRAEQSRLTAVRFAQAVQDSDEGTAASLLDPKPFTDATSDPAQWRAARLRFAQRLVADPGTRAAVSNPQFKIGLVARDRGIFVTGLEPQP